jgi:hypothetical protein
MAALRPTTGDAPRRNTRRNNLTIMGYQINKEASAKPKQATMIAERGFNRQFMDAE